MIMQALADYFDRLVDDPDVRAAPAGFERKAIRFILILREDGTLAGIEDMQTGTGKKKNIREFVVPKAVKRAVNILPNLLWDNPGYVFGIATGANKKPDRVKQTHEAFIERIKGLPENVLADRGVGAVTAFLDSGREALSNDPLWAEIQMTEANISFRLEGDMQLICQRPAVKELVRDEFGRGAPEAFCLIKGKKAPIARLHTPIKGVWGAQPSGANIVSFNLDAFRSQKKKQSYNAPVSVEKEAAYTTALNTLLAKGSSQRIQVGDASVVFWAEKANPMEGYFVSFFSDQKEQSSEQDNQAIKALYRAPETGAAPILEDPTRFFVLGLAPNASRLAVRFWHQSTVGVIANRILQHFNDLHIIHNTGQPDHLPMFRLLISVATIGKIDNLPPKLGGDIMRSILEGTPYPYTWLARAVSRIRAEQRITYELASIVKAILVRQNRFYNTQEKEVTVSLDHANVNPGYRLGRLFAALERAQMAANPGINTTIRDRFYGAASATPAAALPQLLKLKNHHLAKLKNRGQAVNLEKLIGEILDGLDDIPVHLSLMDQGRFALGYYHQRQDFFSGEKTNESTDE